MGKIFFGVFLGQKDPKWGLLSVTKNWQMKFFWFFVLTYSGLKALETVNKMKPFVEIGS